MNNPTQSNHFWHLGLVSILVVGGAIASSSESALAQVSLKDAASSQLTLCDSITNSQNSPCSSSSSGLSGAQGINVGPQPGNPNGHDPGEKLGNTQLIAPGVTQQLQTGAIQQLPIPDGLQQQFNLPASGK